MSRPGSRSSGPDPLSAVSLLLLALLAGLLLWPLLSGGAAPSPYLIASLLFARLGVQVFRAQKDERLKRPASWAMDLLLIALIFWVASNGQ